ELVLSELRVNGGETSFETRRRLAGIAFATTAAYDSAIVSWFQKEEPFPDTISLAFDKSTELAYGENPHQRGAYYVLRGARSHLLSRVELVRGRPLSFNNLNDLERRRSSAERWDLRHVLGGLLVQDPDREKQVREEMEVTCGELDDSIWDDLLFAWRVVKHVTSNAIVLAKGLQTVGIGAGQMSRVDAVRIAVDKA